MKLSHLFFFLVTKLSLLFQLLELCSCLYLCSILFEKTFYKPDQILVHLWLREKKNTGFSSLLLRFLSEISSLFVKKTAPNAG